MCFIIFSLLFSPSGSKFCQADVRLVALSTLTFNIFDHQLHYKLEIMVPRRPVPNIAIIFSPSDTLFL